MSLKTIAMFHYGGPAVFSQLLLFLGGQKLKNNYELSS